jgi:CRISPR/Cas system-associated endonuclease Cas1
MATKAVQRRAGDRQGLLFVDWPGSAVVARGDRLYVRAHGEFAEIDDEVRAIIVSGWGIVVTSDAIEACARKHIEIIIASPTQKFVAIYAAYAQCDASRAGLAVRLKQFAALADKGKTVKIARDIVRRKIMVEGHERDAREDFLKRLAVCKTAINVRHVEAKSAQVWWSAWRNFELGFEKGFEPPKQWRVFSTRYIGRAMGGVGELAKDYTSRFAETPLQAMHNLAIAIVVARVVRVICARGLDPCFGFLHDGRKPGRHSLAWDVLEPLRPGLARAVFQYAGGRVFGRADFASQGGVVRLAPWAAKECAAMALEAVPLRAAMAEVRKIEGLL